MKIAQISSIYQYTPSQLYGSAQGIVHSLSSYLAENGHDITIFGLKNPDISYHENIKFVSLFPSIVHNGLYSRIPQIVHFNHSILEIFKENFDVIHNHIVTPGLFEGSLISLLKPKFLTTLHNNPPFSTRGDIIYQKILSNSVCVAISNNQKNLLETNLNIKGVVHNGIDPLYYTYSQEKEDFLLCLGALAYWKGTHIAVKVAQETNTELIIAGPIQDLEYFNNRIKPHLSSSIKYVGLISEIEKKDLLSKCKSLIFPVLAEEPFGVVALEALASGSPVLTFNKGALSEIISNGKTGYVCTSYSEMVEKCNHLSLIHPNVCRKEIINKFSSESMSQQYDLLYKTL
jgi:glycosyltransferase involved in cell wall biosynthesis